MNFGAWRRPLVLAGHDIKDQAWLRQFLLGLSQTAKFVSLSTLLDQLDADTSASTPVLALTFDDGYRSIRNIVLPICRELKIPFTTFVCSEVVHGDSALWYDRVTQATGRLGPKQMLKYWGLDAAKVATTRDVLSALKSLEFGRLLSGVERLESDLGLDKRRIAERYMTVEDLIEISSDPLVTIGTHTHRHPILSNLRRKDQYTEIAHCADFVSSLKQTEKVFAYPNGKPEDYDHHTMAILKNLRFRAAFTTKDRTIRQTDDRYQLPRIGFSEGDSVKRVAMKSWLPWISLGEIRERRVRNKVKSRHDVIASPLDS